MCFVEKNGHDIAPNRHDLLDAKYSDPTGNLISEVKNGTGKQILCYTSGQRQWELDLVRGKYEHVRTWHPNGQLAYDKSYRNGLDHGPYVAYYPDGRMRYEGEYEDGQRAGIRTDYAVDGTIESVTTYDINGRAESVTTPNEEGK